MTDFNGTDAFRKEYYPTNGEIAEASEYAFRIEQVEAARKDMREKAYRLYLLAQDYGADHLIHDAIIEAAECLAIEAGAL